MRHLSSILFGCLLHVLFFATLAKAEISTLDHKVADIIGRHLSPASSAPPITICRECVYDRDALRDFYQARHFLPAWSTNGRTGKASRDLVDAIRQSDSHGLVPEHYHLLAIETMLATLADAPSIEQLASLDLLLTDAFLVLGSHFFKGRINPATIDPEWQVRRDNGDLTQILRLALANGNVKNALEELLPKNQIYAGLRRALARYRQMAAAGEWSAIPAGPKLASGDNGPRVAALRRRLAAEDETITPEGDIFDGGLAAAVRRFQARHGLDTDAVVGRNTLTALNIGAEERLHQIELNLERWRWLPRELGQRHIIVNIAGFELTLMENDRSVLSMRVVVGKPYRRTPVFSGAVSTIVLNPTWEVPASIAAQDLLPKIKKDPGFLAKNGYRLFRGWNSGSEEVNPATVNWRAVRDNTFPFRLRQEPGPLNALGRVKFLFPNPHDVYLHDTPSRSLFSRDMRTFSSGCIRLEKPLELAVHLLRGTPLADRKILDEALASGKTQSIRLTEKVQVHLLYWTAWADDDNTVHFRGDIYDRDRTLWQAMQQPPPAVAGQPVPKNS
ncbi:MAG: L,D-transpeptidase family protein [Thermodesulfobacteriota bacterium]